MTILLAWAVLWIVAVGLALAATIFWIVELIDVARREFSDSTIKLIWILVILLGHFIGSLIYFFIGRSQGRIPGATPRSYY